MDSETYKDIVDENNDSTENTPDFILVEEPDLYDSCPEEVSVSSEYLDELDKVELRVGKILSCEKHPKADRLLVSQVKVGPETRQIVSGIAKWYKPEEMVGKEVIVVCNLKPVKLRGVESQGMILAAGNDGDDLIVPVATGANSGCEVR